MCGISGYWSSSSDPLGSQKLKKMIDAIEHRGPDSFGQWVSDDHTVHLGHRRLAIQDISPLGHQPMHSESSQYIIVYNGEIYNFKELQRELESLNKNFKGGSDTEVLLQAIEAWGVTKTLNRLEGMYAFALFDRKAGTLTLCRDRLGEKPLYYYQDHSQFVFSSELKSLVLAVDEKLALNSSEVSAFFRFGYFSITSTPFKKIKKLEAGHMLEIKLAKNSIESAFELGLSRYWSISTEAKKFKITSDDKVIDEFSHLMEDVVAKQSIADVELGVFLSGGIDSSLVAATLQKTSSRPIKTFTVAFDEKQYDEAKFAKEIASHLGSEHTEISLSMDACFEALELLPSLLDEPFADASILPTYLVTKEARKHVTVCLSGDGGDELFAGYNRYISTEKFNKVKALAPNFITRQLGYGMTALPLSAWDLMYQPVSIVKRLSGKVPEKDIGLKAHKVGSLLKANSNLERYIELLSFWKNSPLENELESSKGYYDDKNSIIGNSESDFINFAMLNDQRFYLACDNLFKVDRSAMFNSLEVRLPLLSHRVVEFANSLPVEFKIRDGKTKWIMRELLYRSVPKSLIERPKMGFSVPLNRWFKKELKDWAENILYDQPLLRLANLDGRVVDNAWKEHLQGKRDNANSIWSIITYLIWFKKNLDYIEL